MHTWKLLAFDIVVVDEKKPETERETADDGSMENMSTDTQHNEQQPQQNELAT